MLGINEIRLTAGTHPDTATTGVGCFMNVVSYLNGEATITDKSECVCAVVRPIVVWLNDWLPDHERHALLPFLLRAIGSRTTDTTELSRRAWLAVDMANEMRDIAAAANAVARAYAANAARAANAAAYAANAANAAAYAARAANAAAYAANAANAAKIKAAAIAFLDKALPPLDAPSEAIVTRIGALRHLQSVEA